MDEIIPRLWVGDLPSAMSVENLKTNGIFSILSAMRGRITIHETFIRHQILLDDEPDADVLMHFLPSINFIDQELSKGRGVLVHCQAGMSRSVVIVAAYLLWQAKGSLDVEGALEMIRQKRPHVEPNEGFMRQLEIFHKSAFRVSRGDKATRMFYLEKTTEEVMNGDGSPPSPAMFAKFPRTPSDSLPSTPTALPRRRIRCKMCRQELATREHMLDHGQLGPATPAYSPSPISGSPANSRHPSRRSSATQPTPSRLGSTSAGTDTKPRRPSLLSFGGLGDSLTMSTLDPEKGAADNRPTSTTPKPGSRSASAGTTSPATMAPRNGNGSLSAGSGRPFANISQDILDSLSMSAIESSDESDTEDQPISEIKRTRSFGRAAQLGRKMSDALIALPTPPNEAGTETLTTTLSPDPEPSPVTDSMVSPGPSQYSSPTDLAAALSSNPKLAALRSPGSARSMMISPPILMNTKCSGYFVEPLSWMDSFLSSGSVAGKIICPNSKCGAKLGNYDWAGVCCGCKEWVVPGFCIARNKVDEVA